MISTKLIVRAVHAVVFAASSLLRISVLVSSRVNSSTSGAVVKYVGLKLNSLILATLSRSLLA